MAKNKIIAVSGSVGSGKTTLAKKMAKEKGYKYLDVKKLIEKEGLKEEYDRKKQTYDVDVKELNKVITKKVDDFNENSGKYKGIIIDSHLSHYLPKKIVDLCIITTCSDLKKLEKRLKKRKYSKNKIDENIECEIMQVCLQEAKEAGHKNKIVDTSSKKK